MMKGVIKFAKAAGSVAFTMCQLGGGVGFILLGLKQIRVVADGHEWLTFWD